MFIIIYSMAYFGLYSLSLFYTLRSLRFKKKKMIAVLLSIPVIPSLYSMTILNTVISNFKYAFNTYFDSSSLTHQFSSIQLILNAYKLIIITTFEYTLSTGKIICFITLIFSSFYYFNTAKKYTESTKKLKSNERYLFLIFATITTMFIYPILNAGKFLIKDTQFGTRRILKEGCEVIRDPVEAEKRLRLELTIVPNPGIFFYKNVAISKETETTNVLLMGGMGAGKTYAYMMRFLRQIFNRGKRSIVSDVKGDFCEVFGESEGVKILAPLDARSISWDISVDVETEMEAQEFVAYMIPLGADGSAASYFQQAARDIITGVIVCLQAEKPKQWAVSDIFSVVNDKNKLIESLKSYRVGALEHIQDSGFDEAGNFVASRQTASILSDIRAHFQNLEILAKAWPNSCGGFSIKKYARGEDTSIKMLIVPFVSYYRTFSEFFSAMVLDFFFRACFSLHDNFKEEFGVFLDELGVLPRIPSFVEATKTLRTRGGRMFVCLQDCGVISSTYKEDGGTEAIFNGFATKCIGIARTPEYAEYFVRSFGQNIYQKIVKTKSVDSRGRQSISTTKEVVVETAIVSGELLNLPKATRENLVSTMFIQIESIPIIFKLAAPIQVEEKKYKHFIMAQWAMLPPKKIDSTVFISDISSSTQGKKEDQTEHNIDENKESKIDLKFRIDSVISEKIEKTSDEKLKKLRVKKKNSTVTVCEDKISGRKSNYISFQNTENADSENDYMGPY